MFYFRDCQIWLI